MGRRKRSKTDALIGIIPSAFLLITLFIAGGDLRKVPEAIGVIFSGLLTLAVIAVLIGVTFLVIRKQQTKTSATAQGTTAASTSGTTPKLNDFSSTFLLPARVVPSRRLDHIDWFQFEKTVGRLMEFEGWTVEMRGGAQEDGGVDVIATRGAETRLIQCKFWKSWDLNLRTVRELVGARESAEFKPRNASAWIYTLSDPTDRALKFAADNAVTIVTRAELERRLDAHPLSAFPELDDPEKKSCPRCGAPMVNRGKFWGCSNYGRTRCRGTIQIDQPPAA